ncbi:response regulator [Oscillatoria sp. CS-180]|uniref:response regulator n=1 Tax=Oscillatoria sp. CS-180 TaxID=3021720 RepID=UPI00232E1348|nr:response regulator [Oscillatoria sp. CS-180]MDB9528344.1 response regulator [Oscillatoria sp. CS-180]
MRILLVDDDEALMETLAESLIKQRYAVDIAVDAETAEEFLTLFAYDLIVLDVLLPDRGGVELCQQLRQTGINNPILMLTAKGDSTDKVQALDAGADDYVVKPFDFNELCARIRALLRRDSHTTTAVLSWEDLRLDPNTFEVFYGQHRLHTTPKEYALLELFLRHPHRVFSLDAIIESIWSFEDPPSGDAVRTHIKGLRQKLKAGGADKNFIETVYGLGYRLKALETEAVSQAQDKATEALKPTKSQMMAAVAKAWETHQGTLQERLNVLDTVSTAATTGQLSTELQLSGRSHAHKLAGSLGCFGFSEGSRIARDLEHILQRDELLTAEQGHQVAELIHRLKQSLANDGSQELASAAIASAPHLLVVGAPSSPSQPLTEATTAGIPVRVVADCAAAVETLATHPPDSVLLWLDQSDLGAGLELLEAIAHHSEQTSVIVITDIQNFQQRLQLVQQGADSILPATTTAQQAIQVVQRTLQADRAEFKIVLVDDDTQVLELLETLLAPWGLQTTTVSHPSQLWNTLKIVEPHLLVLDVEMPEANGLDLCQVLRADEQWRHLPILFLTAHEDVSTQQRAFHVGADDFLRKSIMTAELPNRILNRLQRSAFVGASRSPQ